MNLDEVFQTIIESIAKDLDTMHEIWFMTVNVEDANQRYANELKIEVSRLTVEQKRNAFALAALAYYEMNNG